EDQPIERHAGRVRSDRSRKVAGADRGVCGGTIHVKSALGSGLWALGSGLWALGSGRWRKCVCQAPPLPSLRVSVRPYICTTILLTGPKPKAISYAHLSTLSCGPSSTGRAGSADHSLHDPGYSFAPCMPACSIASRLWHAVTPEPQ